MLILWCFVQNVISFVNDGWNNMATLNLYANMVSLSPDAYKSFKWTDREVFKSISDECIEDITIRLYLALVINTFNLLSPPTLLSGPKFNNNLLDY